IRDDLEFRRVLFRSSARAPRGTNTCVSPTTPRATRFSKTCSASLPTFGCSARSKHCLFGGSTMTELTEGTLSTLPSDIATPPYDRTQLKRGIAHFGVGNFHRAHQAFYVDRCLALPDQSDWGIVGIGLAGGERGRKKADQFRSQDCLYSLTIAPANG